ncbi:polyserase-related [Holotrichia oblita]|uniref:Polyserase-related n=1 Tax=Holotrichia oblita TaxID=644536 RepID=A0ACB9SGE1_HOLOL|nr:polyserase-related [Holotrichia oblita]
MSLIVSETMEQCIHLQSSVKAQALLINVNGDARIPRFDVIINGTIANIQNYPFYAFIAHKTKSLKCGGAIIKTNVILTAAHCLSNKGLHVYTGIQALDDVQNSKPYRVKQVIKYPKYRGQAGYDIGLIILSTHIRLTPTVKVIPITNTSPRIGSKVTVVGFGGGDSGGPIVYGNRVIGLVSSGEYANCTGYDVQVAVAPYYGWIKKHLNNY